MHLIAVMDGDIFSRDEALLAEAIACLVVVLAFLVVDEPAPSPASIGFCESVGLDYVSCSPFRVPIARLAAAQAALGAIKAKDA